MTHARLVLGALGASAVLAAGCGSSSDEPAQPSPKPAASQATAATQATPASKPTAKALSKAAYIRQADALCREAQQIGHKANVSVRRAFANKDQKGAAAAIDAFGPSFAKKVNQILALPQPKRDLNVLQNVLTLMQAQVKALQSESSALKRSDSQALQQVTAAQQQAQSMADQLARSYGFKACGRSR